MVGEKKRKSGRPRRTGPVIRRALDENLDNIVAAFVRVAMKGSSTHFKLVCELLAESDAARKRDPARALMRVWQREQRKKLAEEKKRDGGVQGAASGAVTTKAQENLEAR